MKCEPMSMERTLQDLVIGSHMVRELTMERVEVMISVSGRAFKLFRLLLTEMSGILCQPCFTVFCRFILLLCLFQRYL